MTERSSSNSDGFILFVEAKADYQAMHLLETVRAKITPLKEFLSLLNDLSDDSVNLNQWRKSFKRLKDAGLVEVRKENNLTVVVPSEMGKTMKWTKK